MGGLGGKMIVLVKDNSQSQCKHRVHFLDLQYRKNTILNFLDNF